MPKMTPKEFAEAMQEIILTSEDDIESTHARADELLCVVLRQLGYGKGIDAFQKMTKWYA